LHDVVWFAALPGYAAILAIWLYCRHSEDPSRRVIADAILIGALGGFLGTIAYDVVRIPFVMSGIRVYTPNSTYGIWILDADISSRFTETVGWAYHFSNGICFGIMYAIFMRGRHWGWAIAWAFLLETIALVSPYGVVYRLAGQPTLIAIAYFGHIAYGLPLGFMVQRWDACIEYLRSLPTAVSIIFAILIIAAAAGMLTSPAAIAVDAKSRTGMFLIEDGRLQPDFVRLRSAGALTLNNPCGKDNTVVVNLTQTVTLASCEHRVVEMSEPGIFQIYLRTDAFRSRSSFVLVEPVYAAR
jgi:hypothetical protein